MHCDIGNSFLAYSFQSRSLWQQSDSYCVWAPVHWLSVKHIARTSLQKTTLKKCLFCILWFGLACCKSLLHSRQYEVTVTVFRLETSSNMKATDFWELLWETSQSHRFLIVFLSALATYDARLQMWTQYTMSKVCSSVCCWVLTSTNTIEENLTAVKGVDHYTFPVRVRNQKNGLAACYETHCCT